MVLDIILKAMNIFLFLGLAFFIIYTLGILLEKIKIPWIFAALILGLICAIRPEFIKIANTDTFKTLADLGMYFLLFLIGFELDFNKIKGLGKFIINSTFFIIIFEAFFGGLLIHFVFGCTWPISALVALSFATIGEAILIPILEEFKLTKTKLGQTILGIGTFDDIIEILIIVVVATSLPYLSSQPLSEAAPNGVGLITSIFIAFIVISLASIKLKNKIHFLNFSKIEAIYLLTLAIFFLFIGIGVIGKGILATLAALLAGIIIKNFLPKNRVETIEREIKALAFGFFGPIFFLQVGINTDVKYLLVSPLLLFLVIATAYASKIMASYLVGRKKIGVKNSIFMGIALGVRFSTSIVIIKILFEYNLINRDLYSILIGSTIAFKFIIPFMLSWLVKKWKINGNVSPEKDKLLATN